MCPAIQGKWEFELHLGQATREERATVPPGWVKQVAGGQGAKECADVEISDESYVVDPQYDEAAAIGT